MEPHHLARLRWEQERALQNTDDNLLQWEKFRSDYVALRERLKTLPEKVNHDVMVPFGSLAFMPGQLVHTNEILVLLGDNYFVERSARQAADIVSRRIKELDKNIKSLRKQRELLLPRADFTNEMLNLSSGAGEMREIVEPYDEEAEKLWREKHREHVRNARQNMKREKTRDTFQGAEKMLTDEDLWQRLDALELQERRGQELERKVDSEEERARKDEENSTLGASSGIREGDGDSDEEDEDSDEEINKLPVTRVIRFSHSKVKPEDVDKVVQNEELIADNTDDINPVTHAATGTVHSTSGCMSKGINNSETIGDTCTGEATESASTPVINSPADIYGLVQLGPKSILKLLDMESNSDTAQLELSASKRRKSVTFATDDGGDNGDVSGGVLTGVGRDYAGKMDAGGDCSVPVGDLEQHQAASSPVKAFTGQVMEKQAVQMTTSPSSDASTSSSVGSVAAGSSSSRPVSKFRASRQKKS